MAGITAHEQDARYINSLASILGKLKLTLFLPGIMADAAGRRCQDEALPTIIISPRHLVHSMNKRTRANDDGGDKGQCPEKIKGE